MPDIGIAGMAGWMMVLMFPVPLLFVVAPEAPLTIPRRYARGDVGTEEYERMRVTLTKG